MTDRARSCFGLNEDQAQKKASNLEAMIPLRANADYVQCKDCLCVAILEKHSEVLCVEAQEELRRLRHVVSYLMQRDEDALSEDEAATAIDPKTRDRLVKAGMALGMIAFKEWQETPSDQSGAGAVVATLAEAMGGLGSTADVTLGFFPRGKPEAAADQRLKGIEPRLIEQIRSEIMETDQKVSWEAVAGLDFVKQTVKETAVLPLLNPSLFTGLRVPPKGLLLFGPPGTGKTLISKCIASDSNSTFFSISASSLTSKWVGEGEKLVRALFAVAKVEQPSVIFIDEIDSLLSKRSDTEHESSRRIKTEFMIHMEGVKTASEERVLVVGATNRPQDLDNGVIRRFPLRLYVPPPEKEARKQIIQNLMRGENNPLPEEDVDSIAETTKGYSGADMYNLCRDAAMGPIRALPKEDIAKATRKDLRPIDMRDFSNALKRVKPTVSEQDLVQYSEWNKTFGYNM